MLRYTSDTLKMESMWAHRARSQLLRPSGQAGPREEMTFALRMDRGRGREGREGHPRLRELQVHKCRGVGEHTALGTVGDARDRPMGRRNREQRPDDPEPGGPLMGATASVGGPGGCSLEARAPRQARVYPLAPPFCPRVPAAGAASRIHLSRSQEA